VLECEDIEFEPRSGKSRLVSMIYGANERPLTSLNESPLHSIERRLISVLERAHSFVDAWVASQSKSIPVFSLIQTAEHA
jgi:hypothetical protein